MRIRTVLYLIIFLVLPIIACGSPHVEKEGDKEGVVSGKGTVRFIDIEGGFYGIIGDNDKHYDPINLSQEFKVDGLRVRYKAKIRRDIGSTHMWGTQIEIIRIEKLE